MVVTCPIHDQCVEALVCSGDLVIAASTRPSPHLWIGVSWSWRCRLFLIDSDLITVSLSFLGPAMSRGWFRYGLYSIANAATKFYSRMWMHIFKIYFIFLITEVFGEDVVGEQASRGEYKGRAMWVKRTWTGSLMITCQRKRMNLESENHGSVRCDGFKCFKCKYGLNLTRGMGTCNFLQWSTCM